MRKKNILAIVCILALIVCLSVVLAACNKDDIKGIYKPTGITYDGARLTWNRVELADYYTVSINGGEAKRVNTNMYSYTATGEFDATVSAVIGDRPHAESKHFIPLDTITDISISNDGMLSWPDVAGATGYRIQLNGNVLPEDILEPHYQAQTGASRIKVRPVVSNDDSYYSQWSAEKQLTKYSAPTNIKYDGDRLTWLGNAATFELTINGQKYISSSSEWLFNSGNEDFVVEVKAIGNHTSSFDSEGATEAFHYLDPVTNFHVMDGVLYWDEVAGAQGYDVRVGGVQTASVNDTKYDKIVAGRDHEISVKPYNKEGNYFSSWSAIQSVYILEAPVLNWDSNLTADGQENNNISWGMSQKASAYRIKVEFNGEDREVTERTDMAFPYAYSEVGVYKISVQAIATDGSNAYDSKYSTPITVERLAAPTLAGVRSTADDLEKGFTVSYSSVKGAKGYKIFGENIGEIQGKATNANSITVTEIIADDVTEEQHYTYYVRSVGGKETTNGQTYVKLDSLTGQSSKFEITVLAMPAIMTWDEGKFTGRLFAQDENAVWNAVPGAAGYSLKYDSVTKNADSTTCSLTFLSAGNHEVSVCAKGNGQNVLASNYTPTIHVKRLEAPTDIRIVGNQLTCTYPQETGYSFKAYIGVNRVELDQASIDNIREKIETNGTDITARTISDTWTDQYATYILSSDYAQNHRFYKYATPTFPADGPVSTRTQFIWNAPTNISGTTPTYSIETNSKVVVSGLNGTAYSLTDLEAGTYQWKVKANGDGITYIDSEYSTEQSFRKLETPKLTVEKGTGLYVWDPVQYANGYSLRFGDRVGISQTEQNDRSQHTYNPARDLTSPGLIEVKLVATGTGLTGGSSEFPVVDSKPFVLQQVVKKIDPIAFSYTYSLTEVSENGAIEIKITKPSSVTNRYQYVIQGAIIPDQNGDSCSVVKSTPGKYNIKVKALGACFDNEGAFYLDSDYAGDESTYIILLDQPTQNDIKMKQQGDKFWLEWQTIPNAIEYEYVIAFDDEDFDMNATTKVKTAHMDSIDFSGHKTVKIKIRAVGDMVESGDGNRTVSSDWIIKEFTL